MAGRLAGKIGIITGAARGQGAAEAWLFASEGAQLLVSDVMEEPLRELAAKMTGAGHRVESLRLDVAVENEWQVAVDVAEQRFGRVDFLINNAGILDPAGIEDTTRESWDRVLAVNQTGVWLGMKAVLPALKRAGGGSILNVSSIYGLVGSGGAAAYHATKGAVRLLTKTAAIEYAPDGIRVNSIHPGYIDTEMIRSAAPEEVQAQLGGMIGENVPLGRIGTAEDIAAGALYLVSDEASYVTGAELVIDGGYTAR